VGSSFLKTNIRFGLFALTIMDAVTLQVGLGVNLTSGWKIVVTKTGTKWCPSINRQMRLSSIIRIVLNARPGRSTRCYKRLNSASKLIQRTTSGAPHRHCVLHRTGCSDEGDQLLREGRDWPCAPRRQDRIDTPRTGRLDSEAAGRELWQEVERKTPDSHAGTCKVAP